MYPVWSITVVTMTFLFLACSWVWHTSFRLMPKSKRWICSFIWSFRTQLSKTPSANHHLNLRPAPPTSRASRWVMDKPWMISHIHWYPTISQFLPHLITSTVRPGDAPPCSPGRSSCHVEPHPLESAMKMECQWLLRTEITFAIWISEYLQSATFYNKVDQFNRLNYFNSPGIPQFNKGLLTWPCLVLDLFAEAICQSTTGRFQPHWPTSCARVNSEWSNPNISKNLLQALETLSAQWSWNLLREKTDHST